MPQPTLPQHTAQDLILLGTDKLPERPAQRTRSQSFGTPRYNALCLCFIIIIAMFVIPIVIVVKLEKQSQKQEALARQDLAAVENVPTSAASFATISIMTSAAESTPIMDCILIDALATCPIDANAEDFDASIE